MLYVKTAHIVSVVAWMAALLYLPRLMVYHAEAEGGSATSATFKVMERRLLRGIANPAMVASWVFGIWLAWLLGAWQEGWLMAKLALVLGLSGYHGFCATQVRVFAADANRRSPRFFRIFNEVPALILVAIVYLVVVKPF